MDFSIFSTKVCEKDLSIRDHPYLTLMSDSYIILTVAVYSCIYTTQNLIGSNFYFCLQKVLLI